MYKLFLAASAALWLSGCAATKEIPSSSQQDLDFLGAFAKTWYLPDGLHRINIVTKNNFPLLGLLATEEDIKKITPYVKKLYIEPDRKVNRRVYAYDDWFEFYGLKLYGYNRAEDGSVLDEVEALVIDSEDGVILSYNFTRSIYDLAVKAKMCISGGFKTPSGKGFSRKSGVMTMDCHNI